MSELRNKQSLPSKAAQKSEDRGFTLIELMVAIVIIAILALIGMVAYSQSQKAARDGKRIADLQEIQKALDTFYANNGGYPEDLTTGVTQPQNIYSSATTFNTLINTYFQGNNIPTDPMGADNSTFKYDYYWCPPSSGAISSNATKFLLCATLENCGNKCNYKPSTTPSDACNLPTLSASATNDKYFCITSLGNNK